MNNIHVNGRPRKCPVGSSVADLVQALGFAQQRIAVERNGAIVSRSAWMSTRIEDGDQLEIVGAVGGG